MEVITAISLSAFLLLQVRIPLLFQALYKTYPQLRDTTHCIVQYDDFWTRILSKMLSLKVSNFIILRIKLTIFEIKN